MSLNRTFSRRRFLATSSLAAGAAYLQPHSLLAQAAAPAGVPAMVLSARADVANKILQKTTLRGGVSVLMGSGGNIAVLATKDGKLLVDSGYASSQPHILEPLNAISGAPLKRLINTHWHFDHTDGNEWMHAAGAEILAHDNTKLRLSTQQTIAAFGATFPPAPKGAVPTETFADRKVLKFGGSTLKLEHYDPAHTDSDISVYFAEADVLHCGDTWFNGAYPFIDSSSGGSINGMIAAANKNLELAGPLTMVIPGHGPLGNKGDLTDYRDVLVYARDTVARLKQEGKTLKEVVAAKPLGGYDLRWGKGFVDPPTFLTLVYQGV